MELNLSLDTVSDKPKRIRSARRKSEPPAQTIWYVPSNRTDLLEVLAAGFVAPPEAYRRTVAPLSLQVPTRLLAFARQPSSTVLNLAGDASTGAFPVLLEVALSDEPGVPSFKVGAQVICEGRSQAATLASLKRVLFRNEGELGEAKLDVGLYDNLPKSRMTYALMSAPDAVGTDHDVDALESWLRSVPPGPPFRERSLLQDRLSGSITLMAAATPDEARAVQAVAFALGYQPSSGEPWPTWVRTLNSSIMSDPAMDDESALFAVAISVLQQFDPLNAWNAESVATAIRRATGGVDSKHSSLLERITAILRGDAMFEGFKSPGADVGKALLLALLEPEPHRLLKRLNQEANVSTEARLAAAALVGFLLGRMRMSRDLRPPALDNFLAQRTVAVLSGSQPVVASFKLETDHGKRLAEVLGGTTPVLERTLPSKTFKEMLESIDWDSPGMTVVGAELAWALGLGHLVKMRFESSGEITFRPGKDVGQVSVDGVATSPQFTLKTSEFSRELASAAIPAEIEAKFSTMLDDLMPKEQANSNQD